MGYLLLFSKQEQSLETITTEREGVSRSVLSDS